MKQPLLHSEIRKDMLSFMMCMCIYTLEGTV